MDVADADAYAWEAADLRCAESVRTRAESVRARARAENVRARAGSVRARAENT